MAKQTPKVERGVLYPTRESTGISVGSPAWFVWLAEEASRSFTFLGARGSFTARREHRRRGGLYWVAYRNVGSVLHKAYLGKPEALTLEHLDAVATDLDVRTSAVRRRPAQPAALATETPAPRPVPDAALPLLTTKLYARPAGPEILARPHLTARLRAALQHRLTLISAPPGFGKTTLLRQWLPEATQPVAWLSLDQSDNDPVHFWRYVFAALQRAQPAIEPAGLALLRSPRPMQTEAVITALLNAVAGLQSDLTLVLDDYHVIDASAIHEGLAFLIDHCPPTLHLALATRSDPALPLARWRVRGELAEVRARHLRFTLEEAASFLGQIMHVTLAPDDVAVLEARTEGWIAGLQLAALSMQGRTDAAGFLAAFNGSHRHVVDYLIAEVLERQPAPVQHFLLHTSILERLCGPLCNALTGQDHGQAILEQLERANLFVVALDDERCWYRYHHLFGEFLQVRLRQLDRDRVPRLHRTAADWFERHGLVAEAIRHALAGQDAAHAARLVETQAETLFWRQGEAATLLRWLDALPEAEVRARPRLCLFRGWSLLTAGQLTAVEPWLAEVERQLIRRHPVKDAAAGGPDLASFAWPEQVAIDTIRGEVTAIRAGVAQFQGDLRRSAELCRTALDVLPGDNLLLRGSLMLNLGVATWNSGDATTGAQALADASAISERAGNLQAAIVALTVLADLHTEQGRLRQAAAIYRRALDLGGVDSVQPVLAVGNAAIGLGALLRERNDLDAAESLTRQGLRLARQWGYAEGISQAFRNLARIEEAKGNLEEAHQAIRQALEAIRRSDLGERARAAIALDEARLRIASGDLAAAAQWAHEANLRVDDEPAYLQEREYLMFARLLIAEGTPEVAVRLLERLRRRAAAGGRTGRVIETLVLQALALQAHGRFRPAIRALAEALALAEPEPYVRVFIGEGPAMIGLLRQAAAAGSAPAYVRSLLAATGTTAASDRLHAAPHSSSPVPDTLRSPVELLSARELAILRLLATGISSAAIARQSIVSINTVKTQIQSIYGKLGVHSRADAIARARDLQILS